MARIGSARAWIVSAFAAVLILEGICAGWTVRHEAPSALLNVAGSAAGACVPVLLGMVLVRKFFRDRLVRGIYDGLAILIWVALVIAIGEVFTQDPRKELTGEGVYLTPMASFGMTLAALLVTSLAGLIVWLASAKKQTP